MAKNGITAHKSELSNKSDRQMAPPEQLINNGPLCNGYFYKNRKTFSCKISCNCAIIQMIDILLCLLL